MRMWSWKKGAKSKLVSRIKDAEGPRWTEILGVTDYYGIKSKSLKRQSVLIDKEPRLI